MLSGDVSVSKMVGVAVWLRLSAKRLLTWNRNYNVKPREISAAQVSPGPCLMLSRVVFSNAPRSIPAILLEGEQFSCCALSFSNSIIILV